MSIFYSYGKKEDGEKSGGTFIEERDGRFVFELYKGLVVSMYEQNGYHDSYFYAVIYLENEDRVINEEYAATAYAGGGNAYIDASPELREKYEDYLRRQAELELYSKIEHLMELGVPAWLCRRAYARLNRLNIFGGCVKLLATKKFRSEFRESLCKQLIAWLLNDNPEYPRPFSDRQAQYLAPYRVY